MVCLLNYWKIKVGKVGRGGKTGKAIEPIIKLLVEKAVQKIDGVNVALRYYWEI
jgi:hypothetical protein